MSQPVHLLFLGFETVSFGCCPIVLASRCKHLVVSTLHNFGFGERPVQQQALVFFPLMLDKNISCNNDHEDIGPRQMRVEKRQRYWATRAMRVAGNNLTQ